MCVVRTSNIHCPSNFKHAVQALLTIVTVPYIIRSPELMHLITESWYPLTSIFPFLPPFSLWQPPFYFDFFRFHKKVRLCNICLSLFSFFFHLAEREFHLHCFEWQDFLIFYGWVIFHCLFLYRQIIYSLVNAWVFISGPLWIMIQWTSWYSYVFEIPISFPSGMYPEVWVLDHIHPSI